MRTNGQVDNHIQSYRDSQQDCKNVFNSYMQRFMMLNRELRTDQNGVTHLLDNVSSVFALPEAKTEAYF